MSAPVPRLAIDIRSVPWIRRLAADYAFAFDRVADLFSGNPADAAAWTAAIARAQRHSRPREAMTAVVRAQLERRGAPAAARTAAADLADPRSVAIVTGQQAGLFGGPLFTLLKAITALRTAGEVRARYGVPAVPVFWIDAEDHDWDEVRSCGVIDGDGQLRAFDAGQPAGAGELPVARVRLDDAVHRAIDGLAEALPPTEHTPWLVARLRDAYRSGAGMSDAFARWLDGLLGAAGLVVYDASDAAAKPLLADLFTREIRQAGETSRLAADAGAMLAARGYHAQVTPQPGAVALFHLAAGREPIRREGAGFRMGDRVASPDTLIGHVGEHPDQFSPNVLLRPVAQDTLFPTAAYIAGPNELGYLAQLGQVYRSFGVPMPLVQPRLTATLLDSNAMRFLARQDVSFVSLQAQDEAALNALLELQLPPAVETGLHDAQRAAEERMAALASAVRQLDATLEGAVRSTLGRMQNDLEKLHGKIIQAAKRRDETLRRQFHHARAQAFPAGQPQERALGFVYFLNRHGPGLLERMEKEPPLDAGVHWVLAF